MSLNSQNREYHQQIRTRQNL